MPDKSNNQHDQEIQITRVLDAPVALVFKAWVDPELLVKWYAPEGCTIHYKKIDIRQGGHFHSCISNLQYGDCWCIGEYKEVVINSKLVFSMINADKYGKPIDPTEIGMAAEWPGSTLVTVTFTDLQGKTRLELRQTVSRKVAEKTGAYPSWLQMLDGMQELLTQTQAV